MQLKLNFLFVESGEEILRKQKIWETQVEMCVFRRVEMLSFSVIKYLLPGLH